MIPNFGLRRVQLRKNFRKFLERAYSFHLFLSRIPRTSNEFYIRPNVKVYVRPWRNKRYFQLEQRVARNKTSSAARSALTSPLRSIRFVPRYILLNDEFTRTE